MINGTGDHSGLTMKALFLLCIFYNLTLGVLIISTFHIHVEMNPPAIIVGHDTVFLLSVLQVSHFNTGFSILN